MALGMIDNTNYGLAVEKTGTFIPNFTPTASSYLNVKQVGNVVYLSGILEIDGTWADITNNKLGDITGVDIPDGATIIPVLSTYDSQEFHNGVISLASNFADGTFVGKNITGTDKTVLIDGFYFTA